VPHTRLLLAPAHHAPHLHLAPCFGRAPHRPLMAGVAGGGARAPPLAAGLHAAAGSRARRQSKLSSQVVLILRLFAGESREKYRPGKTN